MGSCPKCGAATKKDDLFCRSCGTSLATEAGEPPAKERYTRERDVCFEGERHADYTGLISFGIFLLILGAIFIANPNIASQVDLWIKDMTNKQSFVRPPLELINTAALFFGLVGVSNFFMAGVRFVVHKRRRRIVGGILSGVALVVFSYLLYLYNNGTIKRGFTVLAIEVLVIGLLVIVYAAARFLFMKETS
jgi:hypothetical protein